MDSSVLAASTTPAEAVNKGNAFANAAEDYAQRGLYAKAVEAHFRAAEQFLLATSYTADPEATRTLKLLYSNHTRQGKELQRRMQARPPPGSATAASPQRTGVGAVAAPASPAQQQQHQKQQQQRQRPVVPVTLQSQRHIVRPNAAEATLRGQQLIESTQSVAPVRYGEGAAYQQQPQRLGSGLEEISSSTLGSRNFFVGQNAGDSVVFAGSPSARVTATGNESSSGVATVPVVSLDDESVPQRQPYDSIDQSYFVLGEGSQEGPHSAQGAKSGSADDEPEDPFNKFWDVVENLVQRIAVPTPLAFTTAPLLPQSSSASSAPHRQPSPPANPDRRPFSGLEINRSLSPQTRISAAPPRQQENLSDTLRTNNMLNSYFVVGEGGIGSASITNGGNIYSMGGGAGFAGGGVITNHESHGSMVDQGAQGMDGDRTSSPSKRGPLSNVASNMKSTKTLEELQMENEQLKQTIDFLTNRMSLLEKAAEENNMLRSSIIQFRQDVQRQAKRFGVAGPNVSSIITGTGLNRSGGGSGSGGRVFQNSSPTSTSPTASAVVTGPPPLPGNQRGSSSSDDRVAALEAELASVRAECDRRGEEVNKYRDRLQKLKESARKKKEAKLSGAGSGADGLSDGAVGTDSLSVTGAAIGLTSRPDSVLSSQLLGRSSPLAATGYISDASSGAADERLPTNLEKSAARVSWNGPIGSQSAASTNLDPSSSNIIKDNRRSLGSAGLMTSYPSASNVEARPTSALSSSSSVASQSSGSSPTNVPPFPLPRSSSSSSASAFSPGPSNILGLSALTTPSYASSSQPGQSPPHVVTRQGRSNSASILRSPLAAGAAESRGVGGNLAASATTAASGSMFYSFASDPLDEC